MAEKDEIIHRPGKTKRDKESGAWERGRKNKEARSRENRARRRNQK